MSYLLNAQCKAWQIHLDPRCQSTLVHLLGWVQWHNDAIWHPLSSLCSQEHPILTRPWGRVMSPSWIWLISNALSFWASKLGLMLASTCKFLPFFIDQLCIQYIHMCTEAIVTKKLVKMVGKWIWYACRGRSRPTEDERAGRPEQVEVVVALAWACQWLPGWTWWQIQRHTYHGWAWCCFYTPNIALS